MYTFIWWFTCHSLSFYQKTLLNQLFAVIHNSSLEKHCSTRFPLMIHSLLLWLLSRDVMQAFTFDDSQLPKCPNIKKNIFSSTQPICFTIQIFPTSYLQHKMTKISKDHYQFPWTNDMLLLTCIFRLRIQPIVPYSEIADIFMQSLSCRLSGLPSTWAKTHNNSEKWMKSCKYGPNSSRNLISSNLLNVLARL